MWGAILLTGYQKELLINSLIYLVVHLMMLSVAWSCIAPNSGLASNELERMWKEAAAG
jgi:hypothetical protein